MFSQIYNYSTCITECVTLIKFSLRSKQAVAGSENRSKSNSSGGAAGKEVVPPTRLSVVRSLNPGLAV